MRLLLLLPLALFAAPDAYAKDLRQRVGLGYQGQPTGTGTLSLRYGLPAQSPAVNVQIGVVAGFSVLNGAADQLYLGGRGLYSFVAEDNMNLYGGLGAGLLVSGELVGARVQPVVGAEFFLFGLENLGFSTEFGVNLDYLSGAEDSGTTSQFTLHTVSGVPMLGVHYYF